MKAHLLPIALLLLAIFSSAARAQEDTEHQRSVYAEINKKQASYKKVSLTYKGDDIVFDLQGWFDGQTLRKIVSKVPGEDGDGWDEYYLENDLPSFVFGSYSQGRGKAKKQMEGRCYFKDGKMVKWLDSEKKAVAVASEEFISEAKRLTSNCKKFVAAFKKEKSTTSEKPAPAVQTKATEGTFLGIEEGDYSYWNMKTKDGKDISFFILKPDASVEKILDKSEKFVGKKCRIQWKESTENIPEAGGKIKVEQILSVEWLDKK